MESLRGAGAGKRYSKEEDVVIKEAVEKFVKNISWEAALPYRPWVSIYKRAHNLYERDDKREWTTEEYELIRRYHEEHGSDWKTLADALGNIGFMKRGSHAWHVAGQYWLGAISEKHSMPTYVCAKWYNQLSSSMVAEGEWEDVDDYHLIEALYSLDATCQEDVDWDSSS
ncbi:LOW QUALITY PROTEIN: hypothetical protein RJ641_014234 [Dillenia turbinata]|uniref:Myb-like domain-containing protein n=1 Tax=Dillenia turbinata TaxID=194707 RepID=A0AAN8UYY0_9MAGN